jgi:two-component system, LytTR family, response regulator
MYKLTCIVVEDEPLAIKVLTDYISQVPFLELKGSFKDAIDATTYFRTNTVDLMFLDIHLPNLKGIAFLKSLLRPPWVIITTAYHQYAVEGFDLNVTDYLLKPFEFERFLIAVNKVRIAADTIITEEPIDFVFINFQKRKVKIQFSDIVYIESQRDYVKIVTIKKTYLSKISTHEIESLLPPKHFKRIHRSFIISMNKIDSYSAESVEVNGVAIPIGRGYKDILENL